MTGSHVVNDAGQRQNTKDRYGNGKENDPAESIKCPGRVPGAYYFLPFSSRFTRLFVILRAGKIDTFKKGTFLPTYIRKRFAQKLFNTTSDYDKQRNGAKHPRRDHFLDLTKMIWRSARFMVSPRLVQDWIKISPGRFNTHNALRALIVRLSTHFHTN